MRPAHLAALSACFLFYAAILTEYIQEDAFIYFRTASNIAQHADYSFNLGEHYPAATSALYAFLIAGHMKIFGDFFAVTVQIMNGCAAILGAMLLAASVGGGGSESKRFSPLVFWIVLVSPPLVTLATSGMETALVFLSLAALIYGLDARRSTILILASFLVPFLRIEATIAPIVIAVLAALRGDRRLAIWTLCAALGGIAACLATNLMLTGDAIPQTITAKNVAYQPEHGILAIASRIGGVFFGKSFYLGISTKFVPGAVYVLIGIAALTWCGLLAWRYLSALRIGDRAAIAVRTSEVAAIGLMMAFPLGYALGGVVFPWYLWPSSVIAYYLLARLIERAGARRPHISIAAAAVLTGLALANLLLLTNYGKQEAGFRAEVGRFIAQHARPGDTLFLEPAGYIPYFAGLKTWDAVGLVSPDVLDYHRRAGSKWWIAFVHDKKPTYIVDRFPIHAGGLPEGVSKDDFGETARAEWNARYEMVRHFVYADYLRATRSVLTPLYRLGGHSDYYVFRRKREEGHPDGSRLVRLEGVGDWAVRSSSQSQRTSPDAR